MRVEADRLLALQATEGALLKNAAAEALDRSDVTRHSEIVHILTALVAERSVEEIRAAGRPVAKTKEVVPAAYLYPGSVPMKGSPHAVYVQWADGEESRNRPNRPELQPTQPLAA